ncbi:hypothetical protein Pmani_027977 [Petrolisthes manimaculis]|uniref:Cilia- and flagella-associated protein 418 n=1 Tax=Petrolisthes manimaculis TaxID=1843537 RepID=A0AAE1P2L8_9EUCA|nr:hypothetical protein Pmani_027977 [Petrolisthes manimaculis]
MPHGNKSEFDQTAFDIDDLLDEVEESFSATKKKDACRDGASSSSLKTDELQDLLEELEPPPQPILDPSAIIPARNASSTSSSSSSTTRCSVAYLGGTAVMKGFSQGATQRACDRLRCLGCDLGVIIIDGFAWIPHTDYLFLRNNYPNMARLRACLDSRRDTRAYACQCQYRSASSLTKVGEEKGLKWTCGGH